MIVAVISTAVLIYRHKHGTKRSLAIANHSEEPAVHGVHMDVNQAYYDMVIRTDSTNQMEAQQAKTMVNETEYVDTSGLCYCKHCNSSSL